MINEGEIEEMAASILAAAVNCNYDDAMLSLREAKERTQRGYVKPTVLAKHPWYVWEAMALAALRHRADA